MKKLNKENAEKILNQIAIANILDEYDKHLTENNLVLKGNILNEILDSKKLILKDTDLNFSQKIGNDLITPLPEVGFPGLKPGDFWCICVTRWVEAYQAGEAPPIKIHACHQAVLSYVPLDVLMEFAV